MKHIKYIILTLIITFFSITGKSQIIIIASSDSCLFYQENNGVKETFLIKLKPLVKKNKDINLYNIDTFKEKLSKITGDDTANVLKNFYRNDSVKLSALKKSIKG